MIYMYRPGKNKEPVAYANVSEISIQIKAGETDYIDALGISEMRMKQLLEVVDRVFKKIVVVPDRSVVFQQLDKEAENKNEFAFLVFWFGRRMDGWISNLESEIIEDEDELEDDVNNLPGEIFWNGILEVLQIAWDNREMETINQVLIRFSGPGDRKMMLKVLDENYAAYWGAGQYIRGQLNQL